MGGTSFTLRFIGRCLPSAHRRDLRLPAAGPETAGELCADDARETATGVVKAAGAARERAPAPARRRRRIFHAYQRMLPLSISPCSTDPLSLAGSLRVASRLTSKPGSPLTAEVSRQPIR